MNFNLKGGEGKLVDNLLDERRLDLNWGGGADVFQFEWGRHDLFPFQCGVRRV